MAIITTNSFNDDCLRSKNLQFESKGPPFDSSRVRLGGFDVRADQYDQKVDFEYPPQNSSMSNLGTCRSCKGSQYLKSSIANIFGN